MDFIKEIPADLFTISAVGVGMILVGDLSASEQNAVGNWFMLVGQYLETNASQQQVINGEVRDKNEILNKIKEAINKQIKN